MPAGALGAHAQTYRGVGVVVSHDRAFLERLAARTVWVDTANRVVIMETKMGTPSRHLHHLAVVVAISALSAPALSGAQVAAAPWYARVWPVDGQTALAVRATTGQEVRGGPNGLRHGLRVALVVDGEDAVHFDIVASPRHATRWVLRRAGREVRIEERIRRGPEGTPFERVRAVVRTL